VYQRFWQMPIWQEAMEVACDIFNFTESLPQVEDFALTSQLRRSSNSMPANIAEAFGRFHRGNKPKLLLYRPRLVV
jgi:four helix bundle protein